MKHLIFLPLSGILLCSLMPCASLGSNKERSAPQSKQPEWLNPPWLEASSAGNKLWEEGDAEGAVRKWEEAISKGFRDGLVFFHMGIYFVQRKDWKKAVEYLRMAKPRMEFEKQGPELKAELYDTLAAAYSELKRYDEAYIHYQKALKLNPGAPSALLGLSTIYLFQGKLDQAEREAQKVLGVAPDNPRACWIVARVKERKGDYASAAHYYRKVLNADPDWWEARLFLGLLLHSRMSRTEEAARELRKVVTMAPEEAWGHAVLSEIYLAQGEMGLAADEAERALRIEPENYQALVVRGQVYLEQGDESRAGEYFKTAGRANPDGLLACYGLGMVAFRQKDVKRAEELLRKVVGLSPQFTEAAYNLGLVLEAMGRREEAVEQLKSVLGDKPDFTPAHLGLGRLYYSSGKRKPAIAFFRNTLALDRDAWEAYYFLGKCYFDQGQNAAALKYFLSAREIKPDSPPLLTDLALAYERAGELALAETTFEEALRIDPNYLSALLRLGILKARRKDYREADTLYRQALIIRPGEISWGYQGEGRDFLGRMISGLEDYLEAGVDYLSLFAVIKNVSRHQPIFSDLVPVLEEKSRAHPLQPQYPHLLGMIYQEIGKPSRAEQFYLKALKIDSDFAAAHLSLGQLYAQQGRPGKARPHLEAFLSLMPESFLTPTVKEVLNQLAVEVEE